MIYLALIAYRALQGRIRVATLTEYASGTALAGALGPVEVSIALGSRGAASLSW